LSRRRGTAILVAYAGDRLLGDPARLHPVAGFGRLAAALERRAWRPRRRAGALYAGALVAFAGALGRAVGRWGGAPALALVLSSALGGRSLAREGRRLASLLEAGDLEGARRHLPVLAGRDPRALDGPGLARAGVESVAENTADAVVGPLLWGAVAGAGGAAGYRAANTLDAMVGHRSPRYERFGWAAARLDDVLTWPAARLAAGLACLLAPAVSGRPSEAWRALRRDGAAHPSPNAGRLEAAFAGALGVRLGGPNVYEGRLEERPAIGHGRPPGPHDLRRAVRLGALVGATSALLFAGAAR
jgi:adenosylcobinamide-phosphate synthase